MPDNVNEEVMDGDLDTDQEDQTETKFDPYHKYEQDERGRLIVPLKHIIKTKHREFKEVVLRTPLGGDLRIAGNAKNDTDNGLILLERCGEGLTKEAVNNMRAVDIKQLSAVLAFLADE